MIDTDKYKGAKKIVEDAGLIDDNEGHLDVHYRKIVRLLTEVKQLREELRIERRIVQAFYDYRDARCYEDCEAWMLEKGHRVMVKCGNEEQSEWNEAVLLNWWKKND